MRSESRLSCGVIKKRASRLRFERGVGALLPHRVGQSGQGSPLRIRRPHQLRFRAIDSGFTAITTGAGADFCAPLGVTSPACLPVQHGHRDSPLAWRPSERKFPPRSPAFRTFGGGALSAFQKVAPDAVPFGPGLPQGHGGWNQGAGARSNRPLGAVAGVRPLWAGGSGQGSPWDILGAMPACPGPPVRPETAPAARGPGRGIRLGEG